MLTTGSLLASSIERLLPPVYSLLHQALDDGSLEQPYLNLARMIVARTQVADERGLPLALLPLLVCYAVGGSPERAAPAAAAWRALHIAAGLLDTLADSWPEAGEPGLSGVAPPANHAPYSGPGWEQAMELVDCFASAAQLSLARLPLWEAQTVAADFRSAFATLSNGDYLNIRRGSAAAHGLDDYFGAIEAEAASLFPLAARAGACCATQDAALITEFAQFGYNIGMVVRLTDDLFDWCRPAGLSGLSRGRKTLPVYYALAVASPEDRACLQKWLAHARSYVEAELQARRFIEGLGAELYLVTQIQRYRTLALRSLARIAPNAEGARLMGEWLAAFWLPVS